MKKLYGDERGYLEGADLRIGGYRLSTSRGLRPGKQVDVVTLGKLVLSGKPDTDIARLVGCNRKTVWRWKKKLGLKKGLKRTTWNTQ